MVPNYKRQPRRGWTSVLPLCRRIAGLVDTFQMSASRFLVLRRRGCREALRRFHRGWDQPNRPEFTLINEHSGWKLLINNSPNDFPKFRWLKQFQKCERGSCWIRCTRQRRDVPKWRSDRWPTGRWSASLVCSRQSLRRRPERARSRGRTQIQVLGTRWHLFPDLCDPSPADRLQEHLWLRLAMKQRQQQLQRIARGYKRSPESPKPFQQPRDRWSRRDWCGIQKCGRWSVRTKKKLIRFYVYDVKMFDMANCFPFILEIYEATNFGCKKCLWEKFCQWIWLWNFLLKFLLIFLFWRKWHEVDVSVSFLAIFLSVFE